MKRLGDWIGSTSVGTALEAELNHLRAMEYSAAAGSVVAQKFRARRAGMLCALRLLGIEVEFDENVGFHVHDGEDR